jgi:hypothetical protein
MVTTDNLQLVFPPTKDCVQLRNQIDRLITNTDYWAKNYNQVEYKASVNYLAQKKKIYADSGCENKVLKIQLDAAKNIADIYGIQDKARIESQNTKEVNNRKLIGISILLSSLIMIIMLKKKINRLK